MSSDAYEAIGHLPMASQRKRSAAKGKRESLGIANEGPRGRGNIRPQKEIFGANYPCKEEFCGRLVRIAT